MIQNFKHKGLKLLYEKDDARLLPAAFVPKIKAVLTVLDVTTSKTGLKLPGLHPLQGNRKGEWGVTITANWRIVFAIREEHVWNVGFEDYH
jgi:toxin HigB-1